MKFKWLRTKDMDGVRCPWYTGYAYYDFMADETVYYVVPINIIVAAYKWFEVRLRFGFTNSTENKIAMAIRRERRRCITIFDKYSYYCGSSTCRDLQQEVRDRLELKIKE